MLSLYFVSKPWWWWWEREREKHQWEMSKSTNHHPRFPNYLENPNHIMLTPMAYFVNLLNKDQEWSTLLYLHPLLLVFIGCKNFGVLVLGSLHWFIQNLMSISELSSSSFVRCVDLTWSLLEQFRYLSGIWQSLGI